VSVCVCVVCVCVSVCVSVCVHLCLCVSVRVRGGGGTNYTSLLQWMIPSTGHLDPTWVKALIIDTGDVQSCFVTIDAIGKYNEFHQCFTT